MGNVKYNPIYYNHLKIKSLDLNITNCLQLLYAEPYKMLNKHIKEYLWKMERCPVFLGWEVHTVKVLMLSSVTYRATEMPFKITAKL